MPIKLATEFEKEGGRIMRQHFLSKVELANTNPAEPLIRLTFEKTTKGETRAKTMAFKRSANGEYHATANRLILATGKRALDLIDLTDLNPHFHFEVDS